MISKIVTAVEGLAKDPYPAGCRKLQSSACLWRIRVGDCRIIYLLIFREASLGY
uniref:ParE toxin of type II toxin-antitoxin system, parDE n=1 Tax=Candidatus Kentrum sp. LPFa TaxID=2126335 RepID=A0A450W8N7_9GAMM|nr:MAG: hypothetical protein BECKLPF1236B_GA0070989_104610 [Candidatus Kentron sp. LPFa]